MRVGTATGQQKGRSSQTGPDLRFRWWRGHCRLPGRLDLRTREGAGRRAVHMQPHGHSIAQWRQFAPETPETRPWTPCATSLRVQTRRRRERSTAAGIRRQDPVLDSNGAKTPRVEVAGLRSSGDRRSGSGAGRCPVAGRRHRQFHTAFGLWKPSPHVPRILPNSDPRQSREFPVGWKGDGTTT